MKRDSRNDAVDFHARIMRFPDPDDKPQTAWADASKIAMK